MDTVTGYFTALGLSTAAGLNAYIPLLAVGLFSRYTDLIDLPAPGTISGDPLVLGLVAIVGVADFIGDKVPIVDHVLHLLGMAVAPVVGGILALASRERARRRARVRRRARRRCGARDPGGQDRRPSRRDGDDGGGGQPGGEPGEDGASGTLSVTSILWPVVAAILAVLVLVGLFVVWRKWRAFGLRLQGRGPAAG